MPIQLIKNRLLSGKDRLSHAYIITGGTDSDRSDLSTWLAMLMECTSESDRPCEHCTACRKVERAIHPDVSLIISDKQQITVDLIREMSAQAVLRPNEGRRRIFIIPEAERLNAAAQNAMLKVLEEPPPSVAFILLTDNPKTLLQTVLSRCVLISISPDSGDFDLDEQSLELASTLMTALEKEDRLAVTAFCVGLERKKRDEMEGFLLAFMSALRNRAIALADDRDNLRRIYKTQQIIERAYEFCKANVSSAHISGFLSVSIL